MKSLSYHFKSVKEKINNPPLKYRGQSNLIMFYTKYKFKHNIMSIDKNETNSTNTKQEIQKI